MLWVNLVQAFFAVWNHQIPSVSFVNEQRRRWMDLNGLHHLRRHKVR